MLRNGQGHFGSFNLQDVVGAHLEIDELVMVHIIFLIAKDTKHEAVGHLRAEFLLLLAFDGA